MTPDYYSGHWCGRRSASYLLFLLLSNPFIYTRTLRPRWVSNFPRDTSKLVLKPPEELIS